MVGAVKYRGYASHLTAPAGLAGRNGRATVRNRRWPTEQGDPLSIPKTFERFACCTWLWCWLGMLIVSAVAAAQDLEPRAYSPSPVGANFLVMGFGNTSGDVLFDPTLPISDVHANLYSQATGLGHTFGLAGRQSLVTVALPYVWGNIRGQVFEQQQSVYRSGLADLRVKFSFNLHGSPALSPQEFAKSPGHGLIVGTSLEVRAPSGQYDPTRLISIGTDRWSFKPELGISYPRKKWNFDFYTGVWLFTDNSAFFPGTSTRQQDPVTTLQAHVSYTLRRRLWAAFDSTWYAGGASHVNNGPPSSRLSNSRVGATLSVPIGKSQSLKIAYSRGATARVGTNFSTIGVAWQLLWFGRRLPHL